MSADLRHVGGGLASVEVRIGIFLLYARHRGLGCGSGRGRESFACVLVVGQVEAKSELLMEQQHTAKQQHVALSASFEKMNDKYKVPRGRETTELMYNIGHALYSERKHLPGERHLNTVINGHR
jgi:hypothetical protein